MTKRQAPETTKAERLQYLDLLETHPEQFLRIAEDTIRDYPEDTQGYEDCADYYIQVEQYDEALRYLDKVLKMEPDKIAIQFERGTVLMEAERYQQALETFDACDPETQRYFGNTMRACRATCHAYLGNLDAALAECAKLPDTYKMPGIYGEFYGTKAQIIDSVKRVAGAARAAATWVEDLRLGGAGANKEDD